jgi:tellurite resistance protein TerC
MDAHLPIWIAFLVLIALFLGLDLGVFHRTARVMRTREALIWSAVWVAAALAFNVFVFFLYDRDWLGWQESRGERISGQAAAIQYFTGYVVEKSLSVDNLFVIAMIFVYLNIPAQDQHRILFWGIAGAVVLRGLMIAGGVALLQHFEWMIYVFGGLLLISAVKLLITRHETIAPDRNALVAIARRWFPIVTDVSSGRFFVRHEGRVSLTPLFIALLLVENADVVFALDSIPAIFAITRDPFLIFTSNVFAILGLRSLYFALVGLMGRFRYLKMSLVFILGYVGVKMMLSHHYPVPNLVSLAVIAAMLFIGVAASIVASKHDPVRLRGPDLGTDDAGVG